MIQLQFIVILLIRINSNAIQLKRIEAKVPRLLHFVICDE